MKCKIDINNHEDQNYLLLNLAPKPYLLFHLCVTNLCWVAERTRIPLIYEIGASTDSISRFLRIFSSNLKWLAVTLHCVMITLRKAPSFFIFLLIRVFINFSFRFLSCLHFLKICCSFNFLILFYRYSTKSAYLPIFRNEYSMILSSALWTMCYKKDR